MAIATQTLTVNAAFLREIKDDNRQLDDLLAALRELTSCGASVRACGQRFVQLLAQLHKQLFFRFALEEDAVLTTEGWRWILARQDALHLVGQP